MIMALNGIDISSWEGNIDTAAVPADFIIVKRTQGTRLCNNYFSAQIGGAQRSGKLLGIYHYAEGGNATAEADAFVNSVQDYIGKAILCLDWEGQDNPTFNTGRDNAWCKEFCKRVIERTGVHPLIYTSAAFIGLVSSAARDCNCGLWIAQYASMDNIYGYQANPWNEGAYECAIRQYTSGLRLSGYSGNLDGNKFYGDKAAWQAYAKASGAAPKAGKSVAALAQEVLDGKWGNGDDRKNRLTAAGYDYGAVQDKVNELCSKKSVATLAKEVLEGKWGNGDDRKKRLEAAGYSYSAVQDAVNKLCSQKSVDELAREVINGQWGNGSERRQRLTAAGYDYDAVQKRVNQLV